MLIRLRGCAGWSASLFFAYGINRFSHDVAQMIHIMTLNRNLLLLYNCCLHVCKPLRWLEVPRTGSGPGPLVANLTRHVYTCGGCINKFFPHIIFIITMEVLSIRADRSVFFFFFGCFFFLCRSCNNEEYNHPMELSRVKSQLRWTSASFKWLWPCSSLLARNLP